MIIKSCHPQMGFRDVALAAFVGTVAGTLAMRLADYLLGLWLGG